MSRRSRRPDTGGRRYAREARLNELLRQIVAPFDERFYPAASSADLVRIYSDIAGSLPCGR